MRRLTLTICTVLALTAIEAGPASAAPDALTGTAPTTSHALARGILADNGAALGSADVVAVAWPNQATLIKLTSGDVVPTYVLGRTRTGTAGEFAIDVDPSTLPAMYRGEVGAVDVELVFGDKSRESRWNYTAAPDAAAGWVVVGSGAHRPDFRADLGRKAAYDLASDPSNWIDARGVALGAKGRAAGTLAVSAASKDFVQLRSEPLSTLRSMRQLRGTTAEALQQARTRTYSVPGPEILCFENAGATYYGLSEYFMKAYAWSGAMATVHQDYGNDHTLGIGFSQTGSLTSFTQSGTKSVNMAASGVRSGVADALVYNKINYRDYKATCSPVVYRRPLSVNALLSNFTYAPHVTWGTCTTYTGGTYAKLQGTNVTYSAGMDIGPVNVSAKSGWDANTEIDWTVTARTKLCGSSSYGWVSSSQAETHAG